MTRSHILDEIRRTAQANGGVPLGRQRFCSETGIKKDDWLGRYWARWSDALREAGFTPNRLQARLDDSLAIERMALMIREFNRLPTEAELKMQRRGDPTFPSHNVFKRFGSRSRLATAVISWCQQRSDYDDVIVTCASHQTDDVTDAPDQAVSDGEVFGSVYLLRSGRYYKIGRSNAVGRRERELAIQLPQKAVVVHSIKTDDPPGIESYWHRRFEARHKNGEWFELTALDVRAFKRRRFM